MTERTSECRDHLSHSAVRCGILNSHVTWKYLLLTALLYKGVWALEGRWVEGDREAAMEGGDGW